MVKPQESQGQEWPHSTTSEQAKRSRDEITPAPPHTRRTVSPGRAPRWLDNRSVRNAPHPIQASASWENDDDRLTRRENEPRRNRSRICRLYMLYPVQIAWCVFSKISHELARTFFAHTRNPLLLLVFLRHFLLARKGNFMSTGRSITLRIDVQTFQSIDTPLGFKSRAYQNLPPFRI